MRKVTMIALACFALAGCKKYKDEPAKGGEVLGGGGGAVMGVHGAVQRHVTQVELKDLHLFMTNAKLANGRVPTKNETWAEISGPSGNRKLTDMIQKGDIVLVEQPQDEGLWAYDKNAPTHGGWILLHGGPQRVTPSEFAALSRQ